MRRHPSCKCTMRSPMSWEVIFPRECASTLQQLMNLPMYIQKVRNDDGSQEHDELLLRENPQTLDGESKGSVCLSKRREEAGTDWNSKFTIERKRDMRAIARVAHMAQACGC